MLAANSGGFENEVASVSVDTDTFTNKGSFKAVNSGGFENFAFGFVIADVSATNSGTIAAINSGGSFNLTSVFVDAGSSSPMPLLASSRQWSRVAPRGGGDNIAVVTVVGSSLINNGSMVASANGGQGHLGGHLLDFAVLIS